MNFITQFSESFMMSFILWPFTAMLVSIPVSLVLYRRRRALNKRAAVLTYLVVLYALGLVLFTLYPVPDEPAAYCREYAISPRLELFASIKDIGSGGVSAILQITMNILFFIPLGVIAKSVFGWRLSWTIAAGLLTSLLIEAAQATGAFGIYPCSYRLFDLDDLWINTIGAAIGWALGRRLPKLGITAPDNPGRSYFDRLFLAIIGDAVLTWAIWLFGVSLLFFAGVSAIGIWSYVVMGFVFTIVNVVIPMRYSGHTPTGALIHASLDRHPASPAKRLAQYVVRAAVLAAMFLTANWIVVALVMLATELIWRKWHRLPYEL